MSKYSTTTTLHQSPNDLIEEDYAACSEIFKLLSDSNRLRIYFLLHDKEESVINIAKLVDMSSPAVSHHLKQLKTSGLITSKRIGKEMYYKQVDNSTNAILYSTLQQMLTAL